MLAALLGAAVLFGACGAPGPTPLTCVTAVDGLVALSADDLAFGANCIRVSAGEPFEIEFTNHEGLPHNVELFRDPSKREELARGEIITGPNADSVLEVQPLPAGEYYFDCVVHPAMNGVLIAE